MTVSHKQLVFHNCLVSGSALFLLPNRENWKWAHIEVSSFMSCKKIQQAILFFWGKKNKIYFSNPYYIQQVIL